jgi:multiple sugar transport system permease protein
MKTTKETPHSVSYRVKKYTKLGLNYLLLISLGLFFLFPIIFMLVSSVKNNEIRVLRDMASLKAFVPVADEFYRLDTQSLEKLRTTEQLPSALFKNLEKIDFMEYTHKEGFIEALEDKIGKAATEQYQAILLKSAVQSGVGIRNYQDVFDQMPFGRFVFNSVFIVGSIVLCGLMVNSLMAYALARLRFKGKSIVLSVLIALIIIPLEAVVVPLLLIVNRLGWLDSYHVQIIPFIANPFSIFLFYQFFIGLPKDLEEAALVDGASLFGIYWRIILPLSRPVFATVAILQFLMRWNDFLWPLMVTRGVEYRPLMVAIQQFFSQDPKYWGDIMAFASMITIPVLIVFLLFQKWFVQSVATSGVKG